MMKENQKIARTDLAIELAQPLLEAEKLPEGLKVHTQTHGAVEITCVQIASPKASQQLQKPCGRYITIQTPPLWNSLLDPQQEIDAAADCIRSLLPQEGTVLVVGLGNSSITPDALGPQVAQHILVTRHLTEELARSLGMGFLRKTAALIPGVLGQTGVESGELTAALVNFIQPCAGSAGLWAIRAHHPDFRQRDCARFRCPEQPQGAEPAHAGHPGAFHRGTDRH